MTLPYILREEIILKQMDEYEVKNNNAIRILYMHKNAIPLISTTPKQFEVRVEPRDPSHKPLVSDVVDTVQEYFDCHQYGLFDKRPDKETDGVRLYYVASPELVKTVEDNRGYYLYKHWLSENKPTFRKKGLRDITRYYSSNTLDSTARTYYRRWLTHHYFTHLDKFKGFETALAWLTTRSLCLVEEEAPAMIKSLEVEVARSIWKGLMQHMSLPTKGKTIPTYKNFLSNHS